MPGTARVAALQRKSNRLSKLLIKEKKYGETKKTNNISIT